jgi:hypothetical protein
MKKRLSSFSFITTSDSSLRVAKPRRMDTGGNFGGPFRMVKDEDLEEQILLEGDSCALFLGGFLDDTNPDHWDALTTTRQVRTRDKFLKKAITKIGIRATEDAPNGAEIVNFYAGAWGDNDETEGPSADDTFGCFTSTETTIAIGNGEIDF